MRKVKNTLISALYLCFFIPIIIMSGCSKNETPNSDKSVSSSSSPIENEQNTKDEHLLSGKYNAEIMVKDYGIIKLELDADTAPITVTNFVNLAKNGFYDGLTFHRIIDGFMIQGGDPLANGTGGSDHNIKGEFKQNGIENNISHVRGVISMARAQDFDSASSQFFIVHNDSPHLDGQYAAFGNVTEGIEVVDKICENMKEQGLSDSIPPENQPIIEYIKIL